MMNAIPRSFLIPRSLPEVSEVPSGSLPLLAASNVSGSTPARLSFLNIAGESCGGAGGEVPSIFVLVERALGEYEFGSSIEL